MNNLSDKARQHKNEYNAEYSKKQSFSPQRKWDEKNRKLLKVKSFVLHTVNDSDIISHLDKISNVSAYIKELIRKDMNDNGSQK